MEDNFLTSATKKNIIINRYSLFTYQVIYLSDFVDSGAESTEATLTMKYNRNRNVFTTQVEIPDFDVEAGIKVGMTDSAAKGKSITFEISNKNVPQLSLIGRAK